MAIGLVSTDLGYHHMCIKLSVQCSLELYKLKPEFGRHVTSPSWESACPYEIMLFYFYESLIAF